jgi:HTH-type transcriptional regulator / antitoxin HigA
LDFRVIHSEEQYEAYLEEAEKLASRDPLPGSNEAERLELLAVLLENYERKNFKFPEVNPVQAIRFRMEEQHLQQKDLVPFIGSTSRVSEVLSGQRRLTVDMIRALSAGLGIPADVLVGRPDVSEPDDSAVPLEKLPYKEMHKRGYFADIAKGQQVNAREQLKLFLAQIGVVQPQTFLFRRTLNVGSKRPANKYAIYAWIIRVLVKSRKRRASLNAYDRSRLTDAALKDVARLSWSARGPLLAEELLGQLGVSLVIEPHLPQTRLDGAALLDEDGTPVVALTLRRDQIDAFWFTLMHELIHVQRHLKNDRETFVDDTQIEEEQDPREREANRAAADILIPRNIWRRSDAFLKRTDVDAIKALAYELRIHPAIVAGRIQRDTGNYKILNDLVGRREIKRLFPDAA